MQYNKESVHTSIEHLLFSLKEETINLDPTYQRTVVWSNDQCSLFIDSLLTGICPNPIIFSIHDDLTKTCIDGKQRLTSIIKFKHNEIDVVINDESVYYDKCPNELNSRVCTSAEKNKFLYASIPQVFYRNLTYEQESDIFSRIQHGMVLTDGELICAKIPKNSAKFDNLCTKFETQLAKHIKSTGRRGHYKFTAELLYLIGTDTLNSVSSNKVDPYLQTLDKNIQKFTKQLLLVSDLYTFILSNELLCYPNVPSIKSNLLLPILYATHKNKHILDEHTNLLSIRNMYIKMINVVKHKYHTHTGKDIDMLQDIYNIFIDYLKNIVSDNVEQTNELEVEEVEIDEIVDDETLLDIYIKTFLKISKTECVTVLTVYKKYVSWLNKNYEHEQVSKNKFVNYLINSYNIKVTENNKHVYVSVKT